MKTKQQQLTFEKGITNVPTDPICSDNALADELGMVYNNSEHRVIQNPTEAISGIPNHTTVLYVHKYANDTRYIVRGVSELDNTKEEIQWGTVQNGVFVLATREVAEHYVGDVLLPAYTVIDSLFEISGEVSVTSIGKTLVFTTEEGLKYAIWKDDGYKYMGDKIPLQDVEFALSKHSSSGHESIFTDDNSITWDSYISERCSVSGLNVGIGTASISDQETYNNLVIGLYSKQKKTICQKKAFCLPFFVRTALKLYDGSYTHISQPILMCPSATRNTYYVWLDDDDNDHFTYRTFFANLYYKNNSDFSDWSDIVKGVTVFISAPIEINNTVGDLPQPVRVTTFKNDRIVANNYISVFETEGASNVYYEYYGFGKRDENEVKRELTSTSVFYKLGELGIKRTDAAGEHQGWEPMADKFDTITLENITTQEQLPNDDYYSLCPMTAEFSYAYNSRLNLAGLWRGFFEGFDYFMPFDSNSSYSYIALVRIKTESGTKIVRKTFTTKQKQGFWFYYPDPRAEWVTIWYVTAGDVPSYSRILDTKLTEHHGLNGAYYFGGFPTSNSDGNIPIATEETDDTIQYNELPSAEPEYLPNQIATSEVSNPFVFNAEGYNTVGTGKIIGMSSTTQALSQGQFGQYPLLVFTDEGIWAMSLDNTGLYQSVHPMSREVCNNPKSITQTDGAVFFTSDKGLMVAVSSEVRCVSEQMSGKDSEPTRVSQMGYFKEYLKTCFIAYDYRDSLLWIFNKDTGFEDYCYIYAIKTGAFARYRFFYSIENVVNNYPDYLLQTVPRTVQITVEDDSEAGSHIEEVQQSSAYSLMRRPDINEDTAHYTAHILTRPLKLENAFALKSIMQIQHVEDANLNSTLTFRIFASNNNEDWVELDSLRGIPWKYYQFSYDFNRLDACDTFAGTVLISQERRTNKLR